MSFYASNKKFFDGSGRSLYKEQRLEDRNCSCNYAKTFLKPYSGGPFKRWPWKKSVKKPTAARSANPETVMNTSVH